MAMNEVTDFSFKYDERNIRLIDELPPIYRGVYDFRALSNAAGAELLPLYANVPAILNDQFIETCFERAISKWERYLGITPNGTDTLEERRFRVSVRLTDSPPYTNRYLERRLNELCGEGQWKMFKDYDGYSLTVEVSLNSESSTDTIFEMIRDIIPANLVLTVRNYRSRHAELTKFTHADLATYTHDDITLKKPLGES